MEMTSASDLVVHKSVTVSCSVEEAFRVFTEGVATWWPLQTHSLGEHRAQTCVIEGRVGGRFFEGQEDGREELWGTVTVWEPPQRLAYTWHPGRAESSAQEVEVRFTPVDGGTRVELEHRGWEKLGERAEEARNEYDSGWDFVIGHYVNVINSRSGSGA
jgi:uncharacterized protein YndB with AHSA1/START domain